MNEKFSINQNDKRHNSSPIIYFITLLYELFMEELKFFIFL